MTIAEIILRAMSCKICGYYYKHCKCGKLLNKEYGVGL